MQPPFIKAITAFTDYHNLIPSESSIVIGFSGGPDSLFLLLVLAHLKEERKLTLTAAHLDHQWRPESAQEVEFCRTAARAYGVPCVSGSADEFSSTLKFTGSREELGRNMRRAFLERVAREVGADSIALAHHAQDQQETFFIRLIRGASLSGLTGMRPRSGMYIRPLLETNKQDMVGYLEQQHISYLTDPSNESSEFLRNRIRMNVVPALRTCDQRFDANFARTLTQLKKADDFIATIITHIFDELASIEQGVLRINLKKLFNVPLYAQQRIILHWLVQEQVPFTPQESFVDEVIKFLRTPAGGTHQLHTHWYITKKQQWAWIEKRSS